MAAVLARALSRGLRAALLALLALLVQVLRKSRRMPKRVAFVKGVPIMGLLPEIIRQTKNYNTYDYLVSLHKRLGMTFAFHSVGVPIVTTVDPKNIEHVLKTRFDNYVKGPLFRRPFSDVLGDGIFNVDGELWYNQRKISSKMFTKQQFTDHIWKVVERNTQKVVEMLRASGGEQQCFFSLMNRFTLDTIGEIGFSKSVGALKDPSSPFLKSFDYVQISLQARMMLDQGVPFWKVLRLFGLSTEQHFPHHLRLIDEYTESVVEDLIAKMQDGSENSFVGLFMKDAAHEKMLKESPKRFRKYMRDMVLNFLIAGRDTTAQCLTWTFFELTQHQEALAKAREEIHRVCGSSDVTYDHLKDLRYVMATVHEGLRLHPSVPLDGKMALADDTLPDGTELRAGTIVQFVPYAQGRCTDIWGSDAEKFRPDRWQEMKRPSPFEFSAFNAGPRECLGKRLAQMEMACLTAALVREFDFALAINPEDVKYDHQLTLGCSSGMPMTVTARS